jgi:hypothetical protein
LGTRGGGANHQRHRDDRAPECERRPQL